MEDFPLLILFFIFYLVASSSGKNKKNKKRQSAKDRPRTLRTSAQGEQMDFRAREQDRRTMEGFQTAFSHGPDLDMRACESKRIHLHEVTDDQMRYAAEGEDPCHAGGIGVAMSPEASLPEDEEQRAFQQDVLRGVIMSEVLMRPNERRALQRSRQRTNGY